MAKPQLEDGHVEITNDIWNALMGAGLKKNEYRILLCILRYGYGVKKKYANLKKVEIARITRVPLPKVCETLGSLEKKNIIRTARNYDYIYFREDYERWQLDETLTFDEKWQAQVDETLAKNLKGLTKRERKINETLTSARGKSSEDAKPGGSKEKKEKEEETGRVEGVAFSEQQNREINKLIHLYQATYPRQCKRWKDAVIKMRELIERCYLDGVPYEAIRAKLIGGYKEKKEGKPWEVISDTWIDSYRK